MRHQYYVISCAAIISIILIGCGGSEVLIKPNYSQKEIGTEKIKDAKFKITNVIDRRKSDPNTIGTGNVGMFNKTVPYRISVPLKDFTKSIFDSLFESTETSLIPATVFIDTFTVGEFTTLFGEHGNVRIKMYFGVPVTGDSTLYITTRFDENVTSGIDVTDMIEPLVYKGIVSNGKQFAEKVRTMDLRQPSTDTATHQYAVKNEPKSENIGAQAVEAVEQKPKPRIFSDLGVMYSSGDKVQSGIRIFYNTFAQKESSQAMVGFGYNLEILDVKNTSAGITGTIVTFGGNFVYRSLFSDAPTAMFAGIQGTVSFGNETIDYGFKKETSFYFGPIIRETIGVSFNKKAYIEAGLYQIKLFGSKMLPDDLGLSASISFGI